MLERDSDPDGDQGTAQDRFFSTRFYDIIVTATDPSGNEGVATCTVIVVPEDHYADCSGSESGSSKCSKSNKNNYRRPLPPKGKGKGTPPPPHLPNNLLIEEYQNSRQRFLLDSFSLKWNTVLDANARLTTPAPTAAPTGKGKGKGSDSAKAGDLNDAVDVPASEPANNGRGDDVIVRSAIVPGKTTKIPRKRKLRTARQEEAVMMAVDEEGVLNWEIHARNE